MVAGGVYGIVTGGDDDDDTSVETTTSFPASPSPETTPGQPGACSEAAARDFRLGSLDNVVLDPHGRETGSAEINPVCNGETVVLSVRLEGMRTKATSSYYVWLYTSRKKSDQVGSLIGSDGRAFGSATIEPEIDTSRYEEIVITRVKFGIGESRPRKIVFRGNL